MARPKHIVAQAHSHFNIYGKSEASGEVTAREQIRAVERFIGWHNRQVYVGQQLLKALQEQQQKSTAEAIDGKG